jgi:hypothetical protein
MKGNRCILQICDQAVLISGGWNEQTTQQRQRENLDKIYTMLRHHGFKRNNIKAFFADGAGLPLTGNMMQIYNNRKHNCSVLDAQLNGGDLCRMTSAENMSLRAVML